MIGMILVLNFERNPDIIIINNNIVNKGDEF